MGNSVPFQLKGDKSYKISSEKIQELYDQIRHVDYSMCGFVKTLDALRSACELFLRHCDKRHDKLNESQDSNNGWETILTDEDLAVNLLKTLEESVCDQKRPTIESLARLLNFLIDVGTDLIGELKSDEKVLFIDMYLSKEKEEGKATDNMAFTDERIESLRKRLKCEQDLNRKNIKDIKHLEERDKYTRKELDILREGKAQMENGLKRLKEDYAQLEFEYESLKTNVQDVSAKNSEYAKRSNETQTENNMTPVSSKLLVDKVKDTVEINALKDELDNLKRENEHLEATLVCLKRKQFIHVQLVLSSEVKMRFSIDEVLEAVEKCILETSSCLLRVMKIDIFKDNKKIDASVPVLFVCFQSDCGMFRAPMELYQMKGLIEKEKIALVAIHSTSNPSFIRDNEHIQKSETLKDLGGVFNITCGFKGELYACDMNEKNIQCVSDFVETKGLRKSVVETLALIDH